MGEWNFNTRQCIAALLKLGFFLVTRRNGLHDKFSPPQEILKTLKAGQPSFIMVPRHKELHCQHKIVSELRALGGDTLIERFKDFL